MRPKEFKDPFHGKSGVFHLASDHLESLRLFSDLDSYNYGVNTLALAAARFNVSILCYELMDSHLHSLLKGTWQDCWSFFRWVLHRLAIMLADKHGVSNVLPRDGFDVHAVLDAKQFRKEVAYILRNCYKARMCSPFSYPWCSIDVYFNPFRDLIPGTPVSSLGVMEVRKLFRTRETVPGDYLVHEGRVLNRCFVDYAYTENRIGSSLDFFDTLRLWDLESSVAISHGAAEKVTFTDAELSMRLTTLCRNEYHADSPQLLDRKSLLSLARAAAHRFGSGKTQLARLLNVSPDMLEKVL